MVGVARRSLRDNRKIESVVAPPFTPLHLVPSSPPPVDLDAEFLVLVDSSKSIQEALAPYDFIGPDVDDGHLELVNWGEYEIPMRLFPASSRFSPAIPDGCRAASAHELLAFGLAVPEAQRAFPVESPACLVQYSDARHILQLNVVGDKCRVGYTWSGGLSLQPKTRFLFVRPLQQAHW